MFVINMGSGFINMESCLLGVLQGSVHTVIDWYYPMHVLKKGFLQYHWEFLN